MDVEVITRLLSQHGISIGNLVYSGSAVRVYCGTSNSRPAAVKIQHLQPGVDYKLLEREYQSLQHLKHPFIVEMYDCFWCNNNGNYYFVIVLEWCAKDLMRDASDRRKAQHWWTEEELWDLLRNLVSALAFMQRKSYAHRDIKPQNIFLQSGNVVKVGDFGSGKFMNPLESYQRMTLMGTPFFLSPAMKESLLAGKNEIIHNPYKSDVYSLGMTFLLITSQRDLSTLGPQMLIPESLERAIYSIQYSEPLKNTLLWMIQSHEANRCDFIALDTWLNPSLAKCPWCYTDFAGDTAYCSQACYEATQQQQLPETTVLQTTATEAFSTRTSDSSTSYGTAVFPPISVSKREKRTTEGASCCWCGG